MDQNQKIQQPDRNPGWQRQNEEQGPDPQETTPPQEQGPSWPRRGNQQNVPSGQPRPNEPGLADDERLDD